MIGLEGDGMIAGAVASVVGCADVGAASFLVLAVVGMDPCFRVPALL